MAWTQVMGALEVTRDVYLIVFDVYVVICACGSIDDVAAVIFFCDLQRDVREDHQSIFQQRLANEYSGLCSLLKLQQLLPDTSRHSNWRKLTFK